MSGADCYGDDLGSEYLPAHALTQADCCRLCAANPACRASVHIPVAAFNKSVSGCLLKRNCSTPQTTGDRTRCCQAGDKGCVPVPVLSCAAKPLSALPFCNASKPVAERVADLLPRLTLPEKIGQTGMVAPAVPGLGMVRYNFGGEALHGVWSSCVQDNVTTPTRNGTGRTVCATQFPAPIHMAASFNRKLWHGMAAASSAEARGLYNHNKLLYPDTAGFGTPCARSLEGCLGLSYYTPNINIARDPRWGRIEETPGEDPFMNGEYAKGGLLLARSAVKTIAHCTMLPL